MAVALSRGNDMGCSGHLQVLYHGKNKKQCYYRASCAVCLVKLFFMIVKGENKRK